jgi:two-component system chemotaxis response regulator CheY
MTPLDDPFFRVLCADDNPSFQQLLKIGLENYGFDVVPALHGVDALMQYKAHQGRFGAIISDVDMPNLNGLGLVRSVREMGFKGRIVIISGRLSAKEFQEYEPYAISGFFHKPFEIGLLAAMLLHSD